MLEEDEGFLLELDEDVLFPEEEGFLLDDPLLLFLFACWTTMSINSPGFAMDGLNLSANGLPPSYGERATTYAVAQEMLGFMACQVFFIWFTWSWLKPRDR